jgi:hypothetical protein
MRSTAFSAAGCCLFALSFSAASAQTLAHWNFDAGTADSTFASTPVHDVSGNTNLMYGYDDTLGPSYSADTASGSGLSCRAVKQDGYTTSEALNGWSPSQWTIEISVKLDEVDGWRTIIGRDGSSRPPAPKSDFYFQKEANSNCFRLDFSTVDGSRYVLDSNFAVVAGTWYNVALVSNGQVVEMYVDNRDGSGYRLTSSAPLSRKPDANNALAASGDVWTFGRGWYGGKQVDHIAGNLDDIRFSNEALPPDRFLHAAAASRTSSSALDIARNGLDVSLAWKLPPGAIRQLQIYRNDRNDVSGRASVATLSSPVEVYLERVPSKDLTYWYWLAITRADGRTDVLGPVAAKPAQVWEP